VAINTSKVGDSLFGNISKEPVAKKKKVSKVLPEIKVSISKQNKKLEKTIKPEKQEQSLGLPKWKEFVKVSAYLREDQKDTLDNLAKQIMRSRETGTSNEGKERITANSLVRVAVDILCEKIPGFEVEGISNEDELRERMSKLIG
jgi:hypothetical protein